MLRINSRSKFSLKSSSALIGCMATLFLAANSKNVLAVESLSLQNVQTQAVASNPNLLTIGGFESVTGGVPTGWSWTQGQAASSVDVSTTQFHSGSKSAHFTYGNIIGPGVYSTLTQAGTTTLQVGQEYTLSAWVKSEGIIGSLVAGNNWQYRNQIPFTDGQWKRIAMTFTAGAGDVNHQIRVLVENPTPNMWIDDIKLEAGNVATAATSPNSVLYLDTNVVEGDGAFQIPIVASLAQTPATPITATLNVQVAGFPAFSQSVTLSQQITRLVVNGTSSGLANTPRNVNATLSLNTPLTAAGQVTFYSQAVVKGKISAISGNLQNLENQINAAKAAGQDVSYPLVSLTVLKDFVGYANADADSIKDGQPYWLTRSYRETAEMQVLYDQLVEDLRAYNQDGKQFPVVPRWTGLNRPSVSGPSFMGPAYIGNNKATTQNRPIFFNGVGHFDQAQADIEKWPGYGVNIIQMEIGPEKIFPAEGVTNQQPIQQLQSVLDRAKNNGVGVCLLLSPHYFPQWMKTKYPQLQDSGMPFQIYPPEGNVFLNQYIQTLLNPVKDHPALQSVCLTNEPSSVADVTPAHTAAWQAWLQQYHANIGNLNTAWGTSYASFSNVPLPDTKTFYQASSPRTPMTRDYIRFNQVSYANWHSGLADMVHAVSPNIPVHAKVQPYYFYLDYAANRGLNAYLFSQFSQINGNDGFNMYEPKTADFAQGFIDQMMPNDLQRSSKDIPLFNSENHLINDGDISVIPPKHIYTALWQGAIHGQSASTTWVWERTDWKGTIFNGLLMERPGSIAALGTATHDMNRAANEITAIQKLTPKVAILQSDSASVWDGGNYVEAMRKLYTALTFTGVKVGFIQESQLENGINTPASVLYVPNANHLSKAARLTLQGYTGHIVYVGATGLTKDEYDRNHTGTLAGTNLAYTAGTTSWNNLWTAIVPQLAGWGVTSEIQLTDTNNQPVWGVEWLTSNSPNGIVLNLCNYRQVPVTFKLRRGGADFIGKDVLTNATLPATITLQPLETRLLTASNNGNGIGLAGLYFSDQELTTYANNRTDANVDFHWGNGSPITGVGTDNFSVRWTGKVQPRYSDTYTFTTRTDDGVRLWVNGQQLINKWQNQGYDPWSGTIKLNGGQKYDIKMEYFEGGYGADARLEWQSASQGSEVIPQSQLYPTVPIAGNGTGLKGDYFGTPNLTSRVSSRTDPLIDFHWGTGSPMSSVGPDNFSVRWTGKVQALESGDYTFTTRTDDGVRLWVNGQLLIDKWQNQGYDPWSGTIKLIMNQKYDIKMEYFEGGFGADARLEWQRPGQSGGVVIPTVQLYPAS